MAGDASQSFITATPNLTETRPDTRAPSWEPAEEHCAIHPALLLTQRLLQRRSVSWAAGAGWCTPDPHRCSSTSSNPVSVEGHVHVARQLLRLLLRAAPQRLHREALVRQQRDWWPGSSGLVPNKPHTGQHGLSRGARMLTHRGRVTRRVRVRTLMRELWPLRLWVPPSCVKPL